jgi:AcrR family transcriptional regulator
MSSSSRRKYDSPVRRQQAAETRERIVAAGAELVHSFESWDWRELTVRAVAQRAGVNERTVYRHFATERDLRAAVLRRLEEEAGDPVEGLTLGRFPDVVANLVDYLSSFASTTRPPTDPAFVAMDDRRRQALVTAVAEAAPGWSDDECEMAAAQLDMLWSVGAYERLASVWGLGPDQAARVVTGLVRLLVDEIEAGRRPWGPSRV